MLAGMRYVWETKLLLGSISLDLFAVLLGGAVALLPIYATEILHAGPRGAGPAARDAVGGRAGGEPHHGVAADQAPRRGGDALLRGHLRRGDGGLRPLPDDVDQPRRPGARRRQRHGQRRDPGQRPAAGHAARDARPRQRRQLALHRRLQRVRRVRERSHRALVGRGARGGDRRHRLDARHGLGSGPVPCPAPCG